MIIRKNWSILNDWAKHCKPCVQPGKLILILSLHYDPKAVIWSFSNPSRFIKQIIFIRPSVTPPLRKSWTGIHVTLLIIILAARGQDIRLPHRETSDCERLELKLLTKTAHFHAYFANLCIVRNVPLLRFDKKTNKIIIKLLHVYWLLYIGC